MADVSKLQEIACQAIDGLSDELHHISQEIWKNPEQDFNEVFAHSLLTTYLKKKGFTVTAECGGLKTAFRAVYGANSKPNKGPRVGVICEYDALPDINHACGHNLIAEAGIAAALGIKAAIEASNNSIGELVVLGTPAEEGGGGKIYMIDTGCFNDVDFCMMVHPSAFDVAIPKVLANKSATITYHGHAAHAAAFPWVGVNALDAAVACYSSISMLRQQMKPTWRAHGVFKEGGVNSNIIPDKAILEYCFRAMTNKDLDVLVEKAKGCWEGAASATGCSVSCEFTTYSTSKQNYSGMNSNKKLAQLYQKHAESLGVTFLSEKDAESAVLGSTDMGNVSLIKPSIHPVFSIDTPAVIHTHEFNAAAAKSEAQPRTLIAGKSMAMTAIEVLADPELLQAVVKEFNDNK